MSAPKVVPIFFANDDVAMTSSIVDFVNHVGATDYWHAATAEYGVGKLTGLAAIHTSETAPTTIDDVEIQQWLAAHLQGPDAGWPAPEPNTLYAVFYPSGTQVTFQNVDTTETSCTDFGAYHFSFRHPATDVPIYYAVMPRCSDGFGLAGVDTVSVVASHEFIEAATDPDLDTPAYSAEDDQHAYWWGLVGGFEVADMCLGDFDGLSPAAYARFDPFAYAVQRSWSNASALAGHDPCVPIPDGYGPYFNAAPVLPDRAPFGEASALSVRIQPLETRTIEVDLFSDAPMPDVWQVDAYGVPWDATEAQTVDQELSFAFDTNRGNNGDKLQLSITLNQQNQYALELFVLVSSFNGRSHTWVGLVGS
jgi:hypothetical protein